MNNFIQLLMEKVFLEIIKLKEYTFTLALGIFGGIKKNSFYLASSSEVLLQM